MGSSPIIRTKKEQLCCSFFIQADKAWHIINAQSALHFIAAQAVYIITPQVCMFCRLDDMQDSVLMSRASTRKLAARLLRF